MGSVRVQGGRLGTGEPDSTTHCRHFLRGMCLYGDRCAFLHSAPPAGGKHKEEEAAARAKSTSGSGALGECQAAYRAVEAQLNALRREEGARDGRRREMAALAAELNTLRLTFRGLRPEAVGKKPFRAHKNRKGGRAGALRRFVLETYGLEALQASRACHRPGVPVRRRHAGHAARPGASRLRPRSLLLTPPARRWQGGAGVIDVAGGAGELAFELLNLNDVPVTVVDPRRQLRVDRYVRKWRRGLYHRTEPLQHFNTARPPPSTSAPAAAADSATDPRRPRHWRMRWVDAVWQPVVAAERARSADDASDGLAALGSALRAERSLWSAEGDGEIRGEYAGGDADADADADAYGDVDVGADGGGEDDVPATDCGGLPDGGEVRDTLRRCSAILGMHPDGAAEAIVDFALETGKIFALVPCCVFAAAFPTRVDARGRRVTTHDALVAYLRAKAPDRIGVATLPFEGRNKVLFLRPEALPGETCQPCD